MPHVVEYRQVSATNKKPVINLYNLPPSVKCTYLLYTIILSSERLTVSPVQFRYVLVLILDVKFTSNVKLKALDQADCPTTVHFVPQLT